MGSNTYRYNRFKGYTAKDCDCKYSVTVNVVEAIGRRLRAVDEELKAGAAHE